MSNNLRALIVLTSHDKLGDTDVPTGFYWEELCVPYWILQDIGVTIDLASIQGGAAPADPASDAGDDYPEAVKRFLDDTSAMQALENTHKIDDIDPNLYDVIYLPGGHGTMWDFPNNDALAKAIGTVYANGAVVATVCHGAAGLLGAQKTNGEPLVKGLVVNGFTDAEEVAAELENIVPFKLESTLRSKGAEFFCNTENFKPFTVTDKNLITGQNPASSEDVANLIVTALEQANRATG